MTAKTRKKKNYRNKKITHLGGSAPYVNYKNIMEYKSSVVIYINGKGAVNSSQQFTQDGDFNFCYFSPLPVTTSAPVSTPGVVSNAYNYLLSLFLENNKNINKKVNIKLDNKKYNLNQIPPATYTSFAPTPNSSSSFSSLNHFQQLDYFLSTSNTLFSDLYKSLTTTSEIFGKFGKLINDKNITFDNSNDSHGIFIMHYDTPDVYQYKMDTSNPPKKVYDRFRTNDINYTMQIPDPDDDNIDKDKRRIISIPKYIPGIHTKMKNVFKKTKSSPFPAFLYKDTKEISLQKLYHILTGRIPITENGEFKLPDDANKDLFYIHFDNIFIYDFSDNISATPESSLITNENFPADISDHITLYKKS